MATEAAVLPLGPAAARPELEEEAAEDSAEVPRSEREPLTRPAESEPEAVAPEPEPEPEPEAKAPDPDVWEP